MHPDYQGANRDTWTLREISKQLLRGSLLGFEMRSMERAERCSLHLWL